MDGIQQVGAEVKKHQGPGSPVTAGGAGSAANAFSALMETIGSRFSNSFGLPSLESKLVRADDAAQVRARDEHNDESAREKDDARSVEKSESKPREKTDEDTNEDTAKAADETTVSETNAGANDEQGNAAQTDVQVAEALASEFPIFTVGDAGAAGEATGQKIATETVLPQQAALQATQAVTEGAGKDLAAAAVKTDGDAPKVAQVAAVAGPAAKANTDGELAQFRQFTNTASQSQQAAADTMAKAQTVQVKEQVTVKPQETGQKGPLDLRSAAAQDQSQALSKALGSDNKVQVQVTTQGLQNGAAKIGEQNPYNNIYSIQNQASSTSLANGQVGVADATNALVQTSRSPAEQVQAQPAPASPVPAPQPQLQTSQQGTSSSQAAARTDALAPALSQSSQTAGGQTQNNAGFNLNAGQNAQANAETARAAQPTATDRPHTTPQQIIDQIKVNITRASKAGMDRVTIQLKPEHLGRIEVKLEMSEDQKVRVTVVADSKETLQILQTDSRGLERALNEAGLRTDANNLHFNLRGDAESQKAGDGRDGANGDKSANDNAAPEEEADPDYDYAEAARSRGGVDTFA